MNKCVFLVIAIAFLTSVICVNGCKSTSESSFLEMLKLIPYTQDTRSQVYISDYAKIREINNISLPPIDASNEAIEEYLKVLLGDASERRISAASFVCGMGPIGYAVLYPIRRQNIGFGPQDVDQNIEAGTPPYIFEAAKGRYNPVLVKNTLNSYDEADIPNYDEYKGFIVCDWGYGGNELNLARPFSPPFFDQLGRCRPLGVGDGCVLRAFDTDSIEMMIDSSQSQLVSLADNSDFSFMATALSEMGAYSVFLTDTVIRIETEPTEPALGAYQTLGIGTGKDEDGIFMTVVLVYDSSEKAKRDVPVLEQRIEKGTSTEFMRPWRDLIDNYEVWSDGRSLQAKLRGEIGGAWYLIFVNRDSLLNCR